MKDLDSKPSAIQIYLDEIRKIPLLTPQEEIYYCKIKDAGIQAQNTLDEATVPPPNEDELIQQIADGQHAISTMYQSNLRLVVSIAKQYPNNQLHLLDRIQIGNNALYTAIHRYDYRLGRITTIAHKYIKGAIIREIYKLSDFPIYLHGVIKKITQSETLYNSDISDEEKDELLAQEFGTTIRTIRAARNAMNSFQTPYDDLLEFYTFDESLQSSSQSEALGKRLESYLSRLLPLEQAVLSLRFGLYDGTEYQFHEIQELLDVSKDPRYYSAVESRARKKLKKMLLGTDLEGYFDQ